MVLERVADLLARPADLLDLDHRELAVVLSGARVVGRRLGAADVLR